MGLFDKVTNYFSRRKQRKSETKTRNAEVRSRLQGAISSMASEARTKYTQQKRSEQRAVQANQLRNRKSLDQHYFADTDTIVNKYYSDVKGEARERLKGNLERQKNELARKIRLTDYDLRAAERKAKVTNTQYSSASSPWAQRWKEAA